MGFGVIEAKRWFSLVNDEMQIQKEYLTSLDQAIGDGDHGINMARGLNEVQKKIKATNYKDLGELCKDVAMTLLMKVGGASGPLYGTAFLKIATELKGCESASIQQLTEAFGSALQGLYDRGKAKVGDKTMIDVWHPIITYLENNTDSMNWSEFKDYVSDVTEKTKDLEAKKGRAAYLGKRSIGHVDPGSASSKILFIQLANVLEEGMTNG